MTGFMKRIEFLRQQIKHYQYPVVIIETGQCFDTDVDLITYLLKNGANTPDGRIVRYSKPDEDDIDPFSMSLYELIDGMIQADTVIIDDI